MPNKVVNMSFESWDDLNNELRIGLEKWSDINRVEFHENRVCVGFSGGATVCSYFKIEAWQDDVLLFEVAADYRERSPQAFRIGEIVGKTISACICSDTGVRISVSSGFVLIFQCGEMESFAIELLSGGRDQVVKRYAR